MRKHAIIIMAGLLMVKTAYCQFHYIYPLPGSGLHNPECTIILREGSYLEARSVSNEALYRVFGTKSGEHEVQPLLSSDRKTIILKPNIAFTEGEQVFVTVLNGIKKANGDPIEGCSFYFRTRPRRTAAEKKQLEEAKLRIVSEEFGHFWMPPNSGRDGDNFPGVSIDVNTNPAPGSVFFYNYNFLSYLPNDRFICAMTSDGDSVYSQETSIKGNSFDINKNGYLTLYNFDSSYFEMWDSSYNLIDVFKAGNGYAADSHDFLVFPDGHSYLICYDAQIIDMQVYDSTYQQWATVIGAVVQELDENKNVIFEWRSWDHIDVMEANHTNFDATVIDYVHANAIKLDTDSNLLLSCRILDQVIKISRETGEIMWRLGGDKNEFTFTNDPDQFNVQHDIQRLENGHITLFDNGAYHIPSKTSVKEYELDEVNKTATLVWSYSHPPIAGYPLTSWAMGSAQRLANGNTFINWGVYYAPGISPDMTEVDSAGNIVWEMHFTDTLSIYAYRAHRYVWDPCARPTGNLMYVSDIGFSSATLHWPQATSALKYNIQYRESGSAAWDTASVPVEITSYPLFNLEPFKEYDWRIQTVCSEAGDVSAFSDLQHFTTLTTVSDSVGQEMAVSVYPNPATESFTVHVNMESGRPVTVLLFNMLGQVTISADFNPGKEDRTFAIDVRTVPAGIYLLEINANDQKFLQKIMVE
jgi:hypothetical protein